MKSTKALKRSKYLVVAMVLLLAIVLTYISFNQSIALAAENDPYDPFDGEEKKYDTTTIDDDFDDSCVMVVITKKQSEVNKSHNGKFRLVSNIESIEDLTRLTGDVDDKEYLDRENFHQILKINLADKSKQNVLNMIRKIENFSGVLWAGVSRYSSPTMEESNTDVQDSASYSDLLPSAYSLSSPPPAINTLFGRFYQQWGLIGDNGINVVNAWEKTTGSRKIKVGVIDSGIADHPDLNDNVVAGYDFVNDNTTTNDDLSGHGTHVAGIIGASGASANGVVGVNWEIKLVPLQVTNDDNEVTFNFGAVTKAIGWAVNHAIDILNISSGFYSFEDEALKSAISNYKGLLVCSAGNDGADNDKEFRHYPSDYSRGQTFSNRVISVGAINSDGNKRSTSNYGKQSVSIFAPGGEILSTVPISSKDPTGYAYRSGTSMAAPFVTGVAALLFAKYEESNISITRSEIAAFTKLTILSNCTKDSSQNYECSSKGRLNAALALENMSLRENIISDFGFAEDRCKWTGNVDLLIESYGLNDSINCFNIDSNGKLNIVHNADLIFKIITKYHANLGYEMAGTIKIELKNSKGETIPIDGKDAYTCSFTVSLLNKVTFSTDTFTISTQGLKADTYTLYFTSKITRNGKSSSSNDRFSFNIK